MVDVNTPVLTHWAASDVNVNRAMSYQMTTSTVKVYIDTYNVNVHSYNVLVVVQESICAFHSQLKVAPQCWRLHQMER